MRYHHDHGVVEWHLEEWAGCASGHWSHVVVGVCWAVVVKEDFPGNESHQPVSYTPPKLEGLPSVLSGAYILGIALLTAADLVYEMD